MDLARWAGAAAAGEAGARLTSQLASRFGVRHVFLTSTGRAGMTLLLRAMAALRPGRDEVIVPAYTCYSVAASIVKAGLKVRVVDIAPDTLDYERGILERSPFDRVLAIIATNLYGLPGDLPALEAVARRHGAFLIDDAAQAMGAAIDGRPSGSWGDAGLYSFDKGKNVSAIDGGVVVTGDDELSIAVRAELAGLAAPAPAVSAVNVVKAVAYALFLRPWLYAVPKALPGLNLGQTVFTTDFPLELQGDALAALASTMLPRLDVFAAARARNASALRAGLEGVPGLHVIHPSPGVVSADLRLPVVFDEPSTRDAALASLSTAGIGASGSYPLSIADIPALQPSLADPRPRAAGGRHVAARILTLPTHPYVTAGDVARMVALTKQACTVAAFSPATAAGKAR